MRDREDLIGNILIDATENFLMKSLEEWMNKKHPNKKLSCRIGSGKRTYHQKIDEHNSIIVYGRKMIASKLSSSKACQRWLSVKEMVERNYFDKKITPQTALCSVLLHEVAHYFQVLKGGRYYGSVHNDEFYEVLDRIHYNGKAQEVLNYLNKYKVFRELEFESDDYTELQCGKIYSKNDFKKGDYFYFKDKNGKDIIEQVTKVNPKKLKGINYAVPYSLIIGIITDISEINPDLLPRVPKYNSKNVEVGKTVKFKNRQNNIMTEKIVDFNKNGVYSKSLFIPYGIILDVC